MVSTAVIVGLGVGALVSFCLPLAAYAICRGRLKLSGRNVLVGVGCFLIAVALELLLARYVLKLNTHTASWFKAHLLAHAFYGAVSAGVFEETGRLTGMSFFVRREDGAGVAYGIGHGGAEAVIVGGLGLGVSLIVSLLFNRGLLNASHVANVIAQLQQKSLGVILLGTLERASAFIIQIALSLLVWRAVRMKRPLLYVAAVLAHAAVDAPAGMVQMKIIHAALWMVEAAYATLAFVILAGMLSRLPPRNSAQSTLVSIPSS